MGNASSGTTSPDKGKELADKILTGFFNKTGRKDLLQLSSMSACSKYAFSYAKEVMKEFETINLFPDIGAEGEVTFMRIPEPKADSQSQEAIKKRNRICMNVGYFYVRIFQIYAALALTVLDADPVRVRQMLKGGSLSDRDSSSQAIKAQVLASPLAPLETLLSAKADPGPGSTKILHMPLPTVRSKSIPVLQIIWKPLTQSELKTLMSLPLTVEYNEGTVTKHATLTLDLEDNDIHMKLDDTLIQVFRKSKSQITPTWGFLSSGGTITVISKETSNEFMKAIRDYFAHIEESAENVVAAYAPAASSSSGPTTGPSIGPGPAGRSSYEKFDDLKKVFEQRYEGKGEFPKSYAVGRAMTLLTPIFESERRDKNQPYSSQICKRTLNFESVAYMPRAGTTPKGNIHLRSLVSLYYDSFDLSGNDVVFKKSYEGSASLATASSLLAALYNITTTPDTFIESNTPFKESAVCAKQDKTLLLDPKFVELLRKESVNRLLSLQEAHTVKVNTLLQKMFNIIITSEGLTLKMQPAFKKGIAAVNEFGREARALLLDYYLKSEALYIHGTMLFEQNPNAFKAF